MKCIIILSTKSSGSSACQHLLTRFSNVRCVEKTRHNENETLYWTKAASVLGLPQQPMLDSEVPLSRDRARRDLVQLLTDNLEGYRPPAGDVAMIFDGWRALCRQYAPVFLEKSPHHLYQWSALELIAEGMDRLPEVEFLIIGLIRNPMDVLYSAYKRWKTYPERLQYEWLTAYRNLLRFQDGIGDRMVVIRYEDMVYDLACLEPVFEFMEGNSYRPALSDYLHERSLARWRHDRWYGFALAPEVAALAQEFGYRREELENGRYALWPLQRRLARTGYRLIAPAEPLIARLIRR